MRLYLVRHAHAVDAANDAARPLSTRGREQVRDLARFLHRGAAFAPEEIWHSPLVRARETATRLAAGLKLTVPCRESAGLLPEDDPADLVGRLGRTPESLALVGHEPHLSALASLLVHGAAAPPVFLLKKCSVLALEGAGRHWAVRWQISPELWD